MENRQLKMLLFDQRITALDAARACASGDIMTRKMIANALGCAKSPTLIAAVSDAVAQGLLQAVLKRLPNGVDMFVYQITENGYQAALNAALEADEDAAQGDGFSSAR